ncbi:DUF1097 domain-containing protein [Shewanella sp. 3B26]|jgi:hypothetical protein|uniref:DUF1097 domain-containing protein n=1 Tax=Shewanella zhuhaiensis TaxID=2919576 RepID=A0AAJ1BG64_9GAMM|nr:DUF1097 domain-containing protein [Shewanella zhuhaiensis]MCH4294015.1 DUF1097 domain-containing protein [Shewanella zhuhaiensis]
MYERLPVALAAGLLAALWVLLSSHFSLVTWVGFIGCSAYFAQGNLSLSGLGSTLATTLSGVFWAWLIIYGADKLDVGAGAAILTGIVTGAMCLQAHKRLLAFIPGTFLGCCSLFALNGDWQAAVPALVLGALMGLGMSCLTGLFSRLLPMPQLSETE